MTSDPTFVAMAAIIVFLVLCSTPAAFAQTPAGRRKAEVDALLAFKAAVDDPLGGLAVWNPATAAAPCDWPGVACTASSVTSLSLPDLRLAGPISPSLALLPNLRQLSLPSNRLNSSLPAVRFPSLRLLDLAGNMLAGQLAALPLPAELRHLDLSSNAISGGLPENLAAACPKLQLLNLSFNRLQGSIPSAFGQLQELEYLYLDWNLLRGTIPSAIANCSSLRHLSIQGNGLQGRIPAAIASVPDLQLLSLAHNNLSGPIPATLFYNGSSGTAIRVLQLGFNSFTEAAPPPAESPSSLQVLDLQENRISGGFPAWLTNIPSLRALNLSGNAFSGEMPADVGRLPYLQELRVAGNMLHGGIPAEISKCTRLQVLDLENNCFSGYLPPVLGQLTELQTLQLGKNNFTGGIPTTFTNLTKLEVLSLNHNLITGDLSDDLMLGLGSANVVDLSSNGFAGEIPASVGTLRNLQSLNLSGNRFSGRVPASIGNLLSLRSLDLSKQNLSGELPVELAGLPNLQHLSLADNALSGDVPEGFSSLLSLQYLNLSSNAFSGGVPATYGFLSSLAVLVLSRNNITGKIPADISNCSNMRVLDLRSNLISGGIPEDFAHLSRLQVMDLGDNSLTGIIPPQISNCSSLDSLKLDRNRLSGLIPASLSAISNLQVLDISSNNLTGTIPSELGSIASLKFFNVSNNGLEGDIPESLGNRFGDPSAFAANRGLCGEPLTRQCREATRRRGKDKKRQKWIFGTSVTAAAAVIAICCCYSVFVILRLSRRLRRHAAGEKKRSPRGSSEANSRGSGDSNGNGGPKLVMLSNKFSYAEALDATRQFDEETVLSRGRYGVVFKASFSDGTVLAIRRLPDMPVEEGVFRQEAEVLGKVKHRNLTVLRGYYAGPPPDVRLLVYDYMPNGNLATLLQEASHTDGHVLNWPMRHLIALGVARGLSFLHSLTIVHGDVKPQNVHFDADFEAHLADFGLDKLSAAGSPPSQAAEASTSTAAARPGTVGYVPPEVDGSGQATKEGDVYSFGIVLLELLTGKRPAMFAGEEEDIVKWVKRMLQRGQVSELLEPGLLELDPESTEWEEFLLGVKVALLCTAPDPMDRPPMSDVVFMLEGCRVSPEMPSSAEPTSPA